MSLPLIASVPFTYQKLLLELDDAAAADEVSLQSEEIEKFCQKIICLRLMLYKLRASV